MKVIIKNSALKHGLNKEDILSPFNNQIKSKHFFNKKRQVSNFWVLGILPNGTNCEIVYSYKNLDSIVVFHAMTPARKSFIKSVERRENGAF